MGMAGMAMGANGAGLPPKWAAEWAKPAAENRPMQIVHGISLAGRITGGMGQMVKGTGREEAVGNMMQYYRDRGLGGIVCNMPFKDYMQHEDDWQTLLAGIDSCRKLGMVVWIYDEAGYPSGAAGGLVLREHPEYEAQELAYDASAADPLVVRPAYEFTHASNNYYAARRYINLIDDRAVRLFIQKTHEAYKARLGSRIGSTVRAFFTDEPSLITVNLGQIPDSARKNVPVEDPVDPSAKMLAAVPWCYDLADRYRERYGQDLMPHRLSLFVGDSASDREVRSRYWALVAELIADRFFGQIQQWCHANRVAASGHNLWEEAIMHHPTLYGNALKALSRFDIPGLDELSSDPSAPLHGHWMTAALPASAAILGGGRKVFTEISDFSQKMGGQGPSPLLDMQAAAAWQAAFGVTEFTLYYDASDRPAEATRSYGATVGRLNAILRKAAFDPEALLYYPVRDLWAEYHPTAEPLNIGSQPARARAIVNSFNDLGTALTRSQVPFCLVDHDFLAGAQVRRDGALVVKGRAYRALCIPDQVELPAAVQRIVDRFQAKGGVVVRGVASGRASLREAIQPRHSFSGGPDSLVAGRFTRDGRPVVVVVNVGGSAYSGRMTSADGEWQVLDPVTGASSTVASSGGSVPVELAVKQAAILVGPATGK